MDFVLRLPNAGIPHACIPWIAIESENDASSAEDEVRKLTSVAAPLRVLMTVAEWDGTLGGWKHSGLRERYLQRWQEIVQCRLEAWPHPGAIGILVGEWGCDGLTRFTAISSTAKAM